MCEDESAFEMGCTQVCMYLFVCCVYAEWMLCESRVIRTAFAVQTTRGEREIFALIIFYNSSFKMQRSLADVFKLYYSSACTPQKL
jgi:hypothetical protein